MEKLSRTDAMAVGSPTYFTGLVCPNGHVDVRYVSSYACKSCAMMHHKRYRKDDKFIKAERSYKAEYNIKNREKNNEYASRRWRHDPSVKIRSDLWKQANRETINERNRIFCATPEGAERTRIYNQRAYNNNLVSRLARAKLDGAKRRGALGRFTNADLEAIQTFQGHSCACCSKCFSNETPYEVDHIFPISKGGSNWPHNIQLLCKSCNIKKRDKLPMDWALSLGLSSILRDCWIATEAHTPYLKNLQKQGKGK